MIISLMNIKTNTSITLPEKIIGKYCIENEDVRIDIEAIDNCWNIISNNKFKILTDEKELVDQCTISEMSIYRIIIPDNNNQNYIFTEPLTTDRIECKKYIVNNNTIIKIGSNSDSDIITNSRYISKSQAILSLESNVWTIKDDNSSNGTYVNGKMISEKKLNYGDLIFIMGINIIVGKNLIAINNPDKIVKINTPLLIEYVPQKITTKEENYDFDQIENEIFFRSPRFKRDVEKAEFKIDAPPKSPVGEEMPLMLTIGPSMTMGMASMTMAVYGIMQGNYISTVTSGCMLLGTVMWPVISKKYEKKNKTRKENQRQEKYKEYLERIKESFQNECEKQREIIIQNNISVEECERRISNVSRDLWERSYGQNDFLSIRVGKGSVPLDADIKYPERKFEIERDSLEEELLNLCEAPQIINDVPITVSLFDNIVTGVIGDRKDVLRFANGLVVQLSALYSYDEVKFVFLYDEKVDEDTLKYVKWIPHIWDDDKKTRFLVKNYGDIKDIANYLEAEFECRKDMRSEQLDDIKPYFIIFTFSKELSLRMDVLKKIYETKKNICFSVITFFDELRFLPKECSNVIDLNGNIGKIYNKNDISGKAIEFEPDIYVDNNVEEISVLLSNIHLDSGEKSFVLPKMITFLELFGVGKIEHLNVLNLWKENDPTKSLEAQIGVDTIGDIFKLDLHEKYHGPHGLVAGMTGSGKSEFIMTYILSLAVNYHPYEVAFVLIDYKGGGMAKTFEKLPHTAGIITNLDGSSIKRSLTSIQSELRKRQAIFAETSKFTGDSNIDIYRYQRLYREGVVKKPLQHLFIISDEFAELKTQQPEFMTQLVSAARIGRSLGVHLILATQKPSGVVDDQIWSNAKFKACLKVQDKADSMDMLKRPEAAELQETGRFYLQVGYNEMFKMGQSAWSGAPYYPADKAEQQIDSSIEVIDNVGRVIATAKIDNKKHIGNPKKQVDAITEYLSIIAKQENIKVSPLWLEPISAVLYVDEIKAKYKYKSKEGIIDPIIGVYDDPTNQRQGLLTLSLTEGGNTAIYGMTGSGKTVILSTLIYSLISCYSPEEINLYIMDFSAETLTAYSNAPHVGDVVIASEREKVVNLIKLLLGQISTRKKTLSQFGGDLYSYNKESEKKIPSIIVIISNFTAFIELYEEYEGEMLNLTREGTKYGIYFILTASATNGIRFRMQQNISQSLSLQLSDETDYSSIFGKTEGLVPSKIIGRGLCKPEGLYEFQTAYAFKADNQMAAIKAYCDSLRKQGSAYKAKGIPVLPEEVDIEFIKPYIKNSTFNIPVGVETASLEINYFDIAKNYVSFIQSHSKNYVGIMNCMVSILADEMNYKTVVFDINNELLNNSKNAVVFNTKKNVIVGIDKVFSVVLDRHNTIKEAEDAGIDKPEYSAIVIVISSLSALRENLPDEQKEKLGLILEKGNQKLNMYAIIADISKSISTYNFEKWYKTNVSQTDGIWIGNGITDQYFIKTNKITGEMNEEIGEQYGYSISDGKAVRIKLATIGKRGE